LFSAGLNLGLEAKNRNYTTEKTVREIALENPATVRVFETLGIDYCCGGKRMLGDACAHAGVPLDRAIELLASANRQTAAEDASGWSEVPMRVLAGHIVKKHHAYVRQEVPRLESLFTKVIGRHGANHPEVAQIEALFAAMDQELSTHMLKEEQVLFPYIENMENAIDAGKSLPPAFFGSVKRPIANMLADHDDAGSLLERMRQLSNGYAPPDGACPTFRGLYKGLEEFERDLHRHVHLENNILFPRAIEMEEKAAEVCLEAR
jgi:regulator of cell morphogenesis and NO signaling